MVGARRHGRRFVPCSPTGRSSRCACLPAISPVRLVYRPPGLLLGASISIATMARARRPLVQSEEAVTDPGAPFWVPSAALQSHLNRLVSRDPGVDWLTHVRRRDLPARLARTLVVGCGEGFIERALARMPGAGEILAVDADAAALDRARRRARAPRAARRLPRRVRSGFPGTSGRTMGRDRRARSPASRGRSRSPPAQAPRRPRPARTRRLRRSTSVPIASGTPRSRLEIVRRYARLLPERLRRDPRDGGRASESRSSRSRFALPDTTSRSRAERDPDRRRGPRACGATRSTRAAAGSSIRCSSGRAASFGADAAGDERVLSVLCAAEEDSRGAAAVCPTPSRSSSGGGGKTRPGDIIPRCPGL